MELRDLLDFKSYVATSVWSYCNVRMHNDATTAIGIAKCRGQAELLKIAGKENHGICPLETFPGIQGGALSDCAGDYGPRCGACWCHRCRYQSRYHLKWSSAKAAADLSQCEYA